MAPRITLSIEAGTAAELATTLGELADTFGSEDGEEGAAGAAGAVPKPRRKRGAAPPATALLSGSASTPASGDMAEPGPTATAAASPSEPAPAATGGITVDQLKEAMIQAMAAASPLKVQEALTAELGDDVKSVSKVPLDRYADALRILQTVIATN